MNEGSAKKKYTNQMWKELAREEDDQREDGVKEQKKRKLKSELGIEVSGK